VADQHDEVSLSEHVGDLRLLVLDRLEVVGNGVTDLCNAARPRDERELRRRIDQELEQRIRLSQGGFEVAALNRFELFFDGEEVIRLFRRDAVSLSPELASCRAELLCVGRRCEVISLTTELSRDLSRCVNGADGSLPVPHHDNASSPVSEQLGPAACGDGDVDQPFASDLGGECGRLAAEFIP
jgi:hypothetical protein